jgi:hypothetical protein
MTFFHFRNFCWTENVLFAKIGVIEFAAAEKSIHPSGTTIDPCYETYETHDVLTEWVAAITRQLMEQNKSIAVGIESSIQGGDHS